MQWRTFLANRRSSLVIHLNRNAAAATVSNGQPHFLQEATEAVLVIVNMRLSSCDFPCNSRNRTGCVEASVEVERREEARSPSMLRLCVQACLVFSGEVS
ncbi:hypothetical protein SKAU_G00103040 [Synaphobranchus kaupii]|uniref:Uncharacterized protein n=1 Tax=Synaphobranchus kaupii TaxID=118154 RepID=A0A9Q1J7L4_SYNKA|nr:hypothetical protein SKAU_G00103040 [Synaphobranchus kaupii]